MVILTLLSIDRAQREDRDSQTPMRSAVFSPHTACSYAAMRRNLAALMGLHGAVN